VRNKFYLSVILIFIINTSIFGQFRYTFHQFGNETVDFITQPAKWEGSDWLKIALIGGGAFLIMQTADQPIRNAVLRDQHYYKSAPVEFGRMWGELYAPVALFGGFAAYSLITGNLKSRKIAYEIGQASLYAAAVSFILKLAIGRARPYMEEGKSSFHPFSAILNQDIKSMPSGHSTVAFILSTVLSRNVDSPVLKVIAYLPAVLTFASRVYQDQHWTSDTFVGAAIGYFVATWVVDQHENKKSLLEITSTFPFTVRIAL